MRKSIYILLIFAIMFIFACDRFDNDFKPVQTLKEFADTFGTKAETALNSDKIDDIMAFYDDQYMNNGNDKSAMRAFYTNIMTKDSVKLTATNKPSKPNTVEYTISYKSSRKDTTIVDIVKKQGKTYIFVGNGIRNELLDFANNFKSLLKTGIENNQLDTVMTLYKTDYLNNGVDKNGMRRIFSMFASNPVTITIINTQENSFKYAIAGSSKDTIITDVLVRENEIYKFSGNQRANLTHKILAQFATATTCTNCPNASAKLHEIAEDKNGDMIYIEYLSDNSPVNNTDFFNYYGITSYPTTVFQGTEKVQGGSSGSINSYVSRVNEALQATNNLYLENLTSNVTRNTISGTIKIIKDGNVDTDDLFINIAIIDPAPPIKYITQDPIKNLVIDKKRIAINNSDIGNVYNYSISTNLRIPNNAKIVVWLQKMESTYNQATCKIFDVEQKDL